MTDQNKVDKHKIREAAILNTSLLHCPLCKTPFNDVTNKKIQCTRGHSYDIARKGYVNLLQKNQKNIYDKQLFFSRRKILQEQSFFNPLITELCVLAKEHLGTQELQSAAILDVGCGEGTLLSKVLDDLQSTMGDRINLFGIGMDIAKEGIALAASYKKDITWVVADLARIPLYTGSISVLLNVLAPSNYNEFVRLTQPSGIIIKVVPEKDYLMELRSIVFRGTNKSIYSNEDVISRFEMHTKDVRKQRVNYKVNIGEKSIEDLLEMTPLTNKADRGIIKDAFLAEFSEATVDLLILSGYANNE